MKRMFCLLLSVVLVLGLLSGCSGAGTAELTQVPEIKMEQDVEILKAIDLGFVPEALQGDYDSQISYGEFCSILDSFVSVMFPNALAEWKSVSEEYREANDLMSRMEGALVLLYAAECCEIDTVGYEYNIPLEDLIASNVNFYEGVTWDYPLLSDIYEPYYNEILANSEYYSWRNGSNYASTAPLFVEYMSYGNGKTYFDYDEQYSLNLGEEFTRGDAIRAVERLYENARFAQYVAAVDISCTVSDATLTLAEQMPDASWQQLPEWKGYTINPGNWKASNGSGMLYEKEEVEVLAAQGFNFVRVPLDSRMIFNGNNMSAVNPAYLETMDDLLEYCAEKGIHVCFDLHDMPGFYTGGDDSQITLWHDGETQEIFVAFWRFMAEYYKDIPNNLLSFNLLNEPHGEDDEVSDALYSEIMLRAIDAIREISPERLIFVDMLQEPHGIPLQGLADAEIVQTVHLYFLANGARQWPAYTINGFIHRSSGVLTINGDFPAGTIFTANISAVQLDTVFDLEANGKVVSSMELGTEAVGENGCTFIGEEGSSGEYRRYEGVTYTAELTEDSNQLKLVQNNGWWYCLNSITINTGKNSIMITAKERLVPDETVPVLTIDESGNVTPELDSTLVAQSREWLDDVFKSYQEFTEETGTLIMVQEFGFNETIDYQATLAAADDFLYVLDKYDIPWCSWGSNFGPLMDRREHEWNQLWPWEDSLIREDADYEMVSEHWMMDTGLMEVYQKYMNK